MSGLVDSAAESAQRQVDKHGAEWLAKGLASAREHVADELAAADAEYARRVAGESEEVSETERVMLEVERAGLRAAPEVIDAVEKRSPIVLRWGREKIARFLLLVTGHAGEYRARGMLARGQTVAQYLATSDASTSTSKAATAQRMADDEEMLALVQEVGKDALKVATPFVLAALA